MSRAPRDKELEALKAQIRSLTERVAALESTGGPGTQAGLTADRALRIKMLAQARASGNKAALRLWNKERAKELERERNLQGSRS